MTFSSMADLEKALNKAITSALKVEAAQVVKSTLERSAQDIVYNRPVKEYHRRYNLLRDQMYQAKVGGGTLTVTPIDPPNPAGSPPPTTDKDLPLLIETGGYGIAKLNEMSKERRDKVAVQSGQVYDYISIGSRPFVANARNILSGSGEVEQAVADGLRRQGFDVT